MTTRLCAAGGGERPVKQALMTQPPMKTGALDRLQEDTLGYFLKEAIRAYGMVPD